VDAKRNWWFDIWREVVIENFAESICTGCFCWCGFISEVFFGSHSKLKEIGKVAFARSQFEF
jgi:hypothetical protein